MTKSSNGQSQNEAVQSTMDKDPKKNEVQSRRHSKKRYGIGVYKDINLESWVSDTRHVLVWVLDGPLDKILD